MTSLAKRHYQRVSAAQAARTTGDEPMHGDAFHLMHAKLLEDYRRLKSVQSVERKIQLKRELLPNYGDYVAGVLEAGRGAEDEVLMRVMLWRIDVGDIDGALPIARYALQYGLDPGEQFQRSTPAILAEEAADQALALQEDDDHLLDALIEIERLTGDADMHDPIRAKLHKALGNGHRARGELTEALPHYQRALELNDRVGVKKDIERVERALKQTSGPNA
ncbi:phage terminase small subunit [Larsenimonas suaedae]|uniref:Phage terminase small subunit n=1 Tax=Larsenimonas suaedae TaxID=1851019 RepID=A0ABU1GYJ6_9GAMM|nr:phage terminase small subunit [Larsenimonas suaedae]MCM2973509.1 phage terminase small subunit [Larsenimonas suaedae]MDR5897121.1 phage terminase small subunit [Larsenimonas suaedae]